MSGVDDGSSRPRPSAESARAWMGARRGDLRHVGHRSRQVLLLAGTTGAAVGLLVAGADRLLLAALGLLHAAPGGVQALVPALGLLVVLGLSRLLSIGGGGIADEYVKAFHSDRPLDVRPVPGRLLAALVTLASGAPLGYEAPALYGGAAIGTTLQERFRRAFGREDRHLLMVAGAAAGVSAVFKTPVTGLVFALEVPYEDDLAHHMLLPAAISSAASYLVFALIAGTEPLLPITGPSTFEVRDLLASVLVGVVAGVFANLFVRVVRQAKAWSCTRTVPRVALAGMVLGATVLAGDLIAGSSVSVGPGYALLRWAIDPDTAIVAVVAIATLRVLGTAATISGGGVGGMFIPLVVQGALVGRVVEGVVPGAVGTLYPVVGMAAFLGAGYQVPLAAVVFVAEATGRPAFVVPGLIAAVVAQLVAGSSSVSPYQRHEEGPGAVVASR